MKHLDECEKALSFNNLFLEEVTGRRSGKKVLLNFTGKQLAGSLFFDKVVGSACNFVSNGNPPSVKFAKL